MSDSPGRNPDSAAPPAEPPAAYPAYGQSSQPPVSAPAYGQAPAYGGYPQSAKTNVLAIVSLVSAIAGLVVLYIIGPVVAVITGHIALRQLKTSGEAGRGLALTGTIIGWVSIALTVIGLLLFFTVFLPLILVSIENSPRNF